MTLWRNGLWPAILIIALLLGLRLAGIDSWPGFDVDEGLWANGARNQALLGPGLHDGRLHPLLTPAHFHLLSWYFAAVPPSLTTARYFSAACGLVGCLALLWIGRQYLGRGYWLLPFLYGISGVFALHRLALLEPHQSVWLLLTAAAWLSPRAGVRWVAGLTFAMALLVKSNSIYLLPAFFLSPPAAPSIPDRPATPGWLPVLGVAALAGLVAGGGYLLTYLQSPEQFAQAFRFELDGVNHLDGGQLFHVGRFGLHPRHIFAAASETAVRDWLTVAAGLFGAVLMLRQLRQLTRTDRFFLGWLICGLLFTFGQIAVQTRYTATIVPALAYCAARACIWLLARDDGAASHAGGLRYRHLVAALLVSSVAFQAARVAAGMHQNHNRDYWRAADWIATQAPAEARVLASPVLLLSIPQRGYDYYRSIYPYRSRTESRPSAPRPLSDVVAALQIDYILVDDDWRAMAPPGTQQSLDRLATPEITFGKLAIYRVDPAAHR